MTITITKTYVPFCGGNLMRMEEYAKMYQAYQVKRGPGMTKRGQIGVKPTPYMSHYMADAIVQLHQGGSTLVSGHRHVESDVYDRGMTAWEDVVHMLREKSTDEFGKFASQMREELNIRADRLEMAINHTILNKGEVE